MPFAGTAGADGLAAWDRLYATLSHPRCSNCHIGESGRPGWAALGYKQGAKHGMAVQAGDSRIGAESIPCRACHMTTNAPNLASPMPPQINEAWRLPPVEMAFADTTSTALCVQLREGQPLDELIEHIQTSPFVAWGFAPGGERAAAPGSVAQFVDDLRVWGAAGNPCTP